MTSLIPTDKRQHPTAALVTETTTQAPRPIAAPSTLTIGELMPGLFNGGMCGSLKADTERAGKICIQPAGHDGDHSSGLGTSWAQDTPAAPFTLSTPPPRTTVHAAICEREDGHYGACGTRALYLNLTGRADDGFGILQADMAIDDETGDLELRADFGVDDWGVVSSAQYRGLIAAARAHLDRLDALADRYDAITGASE